MIKLYLSLFILMAVFGIITIFERGGVKNTPNNEAAAIQYNGGSGG